MNKRIEDIARLIPGINQSRADKHDINKNDQFYDQSMFEVDLTRMHECSLIQQGRLKYQDDIYLSEGDIVISSTMQLATIVGNSDRRRILTINFIKVILNDEVDKAYFVYLYNLNQNIKKQKERETQIMGLVQRLTLKSMGSIEIPFVPKNQQIKIGNCYIEMIKIKNNLNQYAELIEKMTYSVLEDNLKED